MRGIMWAAGMLMMGLAVLGAGVTPLAAQAVTGATNASSTTSTANTASTTSTMPPATAASEYAYKQAPGPYAVVTIADLRLYDAKRDEDLSLCLRGPKLPAGDKSLLPMVVFSHGAGGDSHAFGELCAHWASYGYVVVNPTHSDSIRQRRAQGETFDPLSSTVYQQVIGKVNLQDRTADVRLILDSIPALEAALQHAAVGDHGDTTAASAPTWHIDRDRIAMAGHSAGAMTTQVLAGVRFYGPLGGRYVSRPEARFKAFILVSGQGTSWRFFNKDSWEDVHAPMLVITGSKDLTPASPNETPKSRREPYDYAPPGDKYLVYIDGATHGSYAGKNVVRILNETPPANIPYITDITAFSTLAFLDATLRHDAAATAYLQSDALTRYPGGRSDYAHK